MVLCNQVRITLKICDFTFLSKISFIDLTAALREYNPHVACLCWFNCCCITRISLCNVETTILNSATSSLLSAKRGVKTLQLPYKHLYQLGTPVEDSYSINPTWRKSCFFYSCLQFCFLCQVFFQVYLQFSHSSL